MNDTTQMKTAELTGKALDWAVAQAEGATNLRHDTVATWWFTDSKGRHRALSSRWSRAQNWHPSTNWEQAGPIIERENIYLCGKQWQGGTWVGVINCPKGGMPIASKQGDTALIAAMRCYVASKLGDVVEVPAELLSTEEHA